MVEIAQRLEEFDEYQLIKIDNKGRCVITNHGYFDEFDMLVIEVAFSFSYCVS